MTAPHDEPHFDAKSHCRCMCALCWDDYCCCADCVCGVE